MAQDGVQRSDIARREGRGQHEQAEEQPELYGPLGIERHVKQDGRALTLYARREHDDE
jgi:hypothetical protein